MSKAKNFPFPEPAQTSDWPSTTVGDMLAESPVRKDQRYPPSRSTAKYRPGCGTLPISPANISPWYSLGEENGTQYGMGGPEFLNFSWLSSP
jgi:hypothetical protein